MVAKQKGFTLIEILLVMVIISAIIYGMVGYVQTKTEQTRIDRASIQMQQILNAGLAYYIDNGKWPTALSDLQGKYLPPASVTFNNPWARPFHIYSYPISDDNPKLFYVYTEITSATGSGSANAAATSIAGLLPSGYATPAGSSGGEPPQPAGSCGKSTACYVVASVNIPGQNLNNARAVNFAGLYHQGACVPVPECPVDANGTQMTPEIMVVPVSVSGLNGPAGGTGTTNVYPISSFTAYARGGDSQSPPQCTHSTSAPSCLTNNIGTAAKYWRVCLQVVTEKGDVQQTAPLNPDWGQSVTVMAITRCSVNNEPAGSNFSVYSN